MSFNLQKILESKRALRRELAARPVAEKLRMLDALRERELAIRGRADTHGIRDGRDYRDEVGRVPSRGVPVGPPTRAASGDAACNAHGPGPVGPVPSHGVPVPEPDQGQPRRLRHLHRVWPDRDGNISYLLTMCVDSRARVLNNKPTFERLVAFLLDSPTRYRWFGAASSSCPTTFI